MEIVTTNGMYMHERNNTTRTVWASPILNGWSNGENGVHYSSVLHHFYWDLSPSQQPVCEWQECGMGPETVHVEWEWRVITFKLFSCCWCTGGKMDQTEWTVQNGGGGSGERFVCLRKSDYSPDIQIGTLSRVINCDRHELHMGPWEDKL